MFTLWSTVLFGTVTRSDDCPCTPLLSFPEWRHENGYWYGEYTFLGADGGYYNSSSAPDRLYDDYRGFIHIIIDGCSLKQRNIFLNPTVSGRGAEERLFEADQDSNSSDGSLSGLYLNFASTTTRIVDQYTVQYQVEVNGAILQNQMTTLLNTSDGTQYRVRTAQGIDSIVFGGTNEASYASFYRETKVNKSEFYRLLNETRTAYNTTMLAFNSSEEYEAYFHPNITVAAECVNLTTTTEEPTSSTVRDDQSRDDLESEEDTTEFQMYLAIAIVEAVLLCVALISCIRLFIMWKQLQQVTVNMALNIESNAKAQPVDGPDGAGATTTV